MQLCEGPRRGEHDEVCFNSQFCPVCDLQEKLDKANDKIVDLEEQLQNVS